jgi:hypothetical protein
MKRRNTHPKLATRRQRHEVSYLARKYRVRNEMVRRILGRIGRRSHTRVQLALRKVAARNRKAHRDATA